MQVRITNRTREMLLAETTPGISKEGWNIFGLDGYWRIDIDQAVASKLKQHGASLNDPYSIENVVEELVSNKP